MKFNSLKGIENNKISQINNKKQYKWGKDNGKSPIQQK